MFGFGSDENNERDVSEIHYSLVQSTVRVRGRVETTVDEYDGTSEDVQDIHVELVQRGDDGARRSLRTGVGTQNLSVAVTPDSRLASVENKHVGAAPGVVTAGVKLIGFIGGTVLSALSGRPGRPAEQRDPDKDPPPPPPRDPRADWAAANEEAAAQLAANKTLASTAATQLAVVRTEIVDAHWLTVRELQVRATAIAGVLQSARAEIARIEGLYSAWRSGQKTTRSATVECYAALEDIPLRPANSPASTPPGLPPTDGPLAQLWSDFKVQLELVDARRESKAKPTTSPALGDRESHFVRWRVPRQIELWVWSGTGEVEDGVEQVGLVTRTPVVISDALCNVLGMELKEGSFGEHGGAWIFNDNGSPASIKTSDKSAMGAFADALAGAPESLVGAVEQAKKLNDTIGGIQDARVVRDQVAAERELAIAKAHVETLGVNATAADVADLARAEHAVKLRTAQRAISPEADSIDDLKRQLDRTTTEGQLEAARRANALETELAEIKAQLARVQQDVLLARKEGQLENGGVDPTNPVGGEPEAGEDDLDKPK